MAYELELPQESKIHNVFHVSNLKKTIGQHIAPSIELPPLDDEGLLILIPERIIQTRERKVRNKVIREYLVQWKNYRQRMPHGKVNRYCSIPVCSCLRTSNLKRGGL